jgi:hypothetical protein
VRHAGGQPAGEGQPGSLTLDVSATEITLTDDAFGMPFELVVTKS